MRHEVIREVPYLARTGGYIPYIDHETPLDVGWANFQEYTRQVRASAATD